MGLDKVKVEKFIAAAMKYKGDKYSQPRRMERGYSDCSSLIYKALRDAGLLDSKETTRTISTKFMRDGDPRFEQIPLSQAKRGDILWGQDNTPQYGGHVAIYLGDGKTLEARVREGVDFNKNRKYFTRAYRIVALEEAAEKPSRPSTSRPEAPKSRVIENVEIYIHNKALPVKGYIIDGITFLEVNGTTIGVRKFFEGLKMKVQYDDGKVYIS